MSNLFTFAASFSLLVPVFGASGAVEQGIGGHIPDNAPVVDAPVCQSASLMGDEGEDPQASFPSSASSAIDAISPIETMQRRSSRNQVRIEQRVIIRVSPQRGRARVELSAGMPRTSPNRRYVEKDIGGCIRANRIAGVQTGNGNRLFLFMRDNRLISVNLERSCRAREFYSGFYVEPNDDGRICIERDRLQSRNGTKCQIERMSQLEQVQT